MSRAAGASPAGPPVAGGVVGNGRYRLLARHGFDAGAGAFLWRARDRRTGQDVALTVLAADPADVGAARMAGRTLERAARTAAFAGDAVAPVFDVLRPGRGNGAGEGQLGVVVAAWTPGTDLVDWATGRPVAPADAVGMVRPLAGAATRAHRAGVVLGLDQLPRMRVDRDQRIRLAFPGPRPEATAGDDVAGLGAVLYLLLTGRAALPGRVAPPHELDPRIPRPVSALAVRLIDDARRRVSRPAADVARALDEVSVVDHPTRELGPVAGDVSGRSRPAARPAGSTPAADITRRRRVAVAVSVFVVLLAGVLAWTGLIGINAVVDDRAAEPPPSTALRSPVGTSPQAALQAPPLTTGSTPSAPSTAEVSVAPDSVELVDPDGGGDHPDRAKNVIDGHADTAWHTDLYRQQLPALKPGVGLIATFGKPITLRKVRITTEGAGTAVEIRLADSASPDLSATRLVGTAELGGGETELTVAAGEPARYVLVWITRLSQVDGGFRATVDELAFSAVS